MIDSSLHFIAENQPPIRFETVKSKPIKYPEIYRNMISVDVIHDGCYIPPKYLSDSEGNPFDQEIIQRSFQIERDWGANMVARRIAESLGLDGFTTVNTARCLLDFGRFPGSTRGNATHLGRFAINYPYSSLLDFYQKRTLLSEHYDQISKMMDKTLEGKLLKIAIHTYDQYNESGTERPHVSLVTRTLEYQMESRMPLGVFDPLYPDILAEFTVDRVLRDRISLTLEKNNIPVAHNYPYLLPEGSTEVRHQVWRFFNWLHHRFERDYPEIKGDPAYDRVWEMLKDTNLRSARAGELRSVLHMYREPPRETAGLYEYIIDAYRNIFLFVSKDNRKIIEEYRRSPMRCMSMGIEIRKDLVWNFDESGRPISPNPEFGLFIAEKIADAVGTYFSEDRSEMGRKPNKQDHWFLPASSTTFSPI
ncbi:MAG: hypothetical protein CMK59_04175 [Proteobacteria bacterium]|nr:hypothetical protein [Pseudomonadota bacterium]